MVLGSRRLTMHIFGAYAQVGPPGGWPDWLAAFMRLAWIPHPRQEWLVLNIRPAWLVLQARPNLVLISSAPNAWADVLLLTTVNMTATAIVSSRIAGRIT
jgi:hypothetical protein